LFEELCQLVVPRLVHSPDYLLNIAVDNTDIDYRSTTGCRTEMARSGLFVCRFNPISRLRISIAARIPTYAVPFLLNKVSTEHSLSLAEKIGEDR